MPGVNGHDTPELRSNMPACWQSMGVSLGVYVRMPDDREPAFTAGHGRPVSREDLRGAINFLTVLMEKLDA